MFLDIHAHVYKYQYPTPGGPDLFIGPEALLKLHDSLQIEQAVLLPLVSPEVYVPQSVGEIIDLANASGGRWIPFCNVDPRVYSNTSDSPIGHLLEHYRKLGCRGIGEVLPKMTWNDPKMQNLLRHVQDIGWPLLFDMTGSRPGGYGVGDEAGMPQLEESLRRFPNLIFIGHGPAFWAEISVLRDPDDRHGYPSYPLIAEGRVAQLMRAYENLWVDLSAGSGLNAMKRSPDYSVEFLNEFQDRIMFGTDVCSERDVVGICDFLLNLRAQGHLSAETFEKIARGNARRLLKL